PRAARAACRADLLAHRGDRGNRRRILLPRADAVDLLHRQHKDLAVSHLAGARGAHDGPHRGLDEVVGDADLEADLLRQPDLDRGSPVGLHAFQLTAVALNPAHGQPTDLGPIERLEHLADLVRTDNRHDEFHALASTLPRPASRAASASAPSGYTRIAPSPVVYASSPC